MPSRAEVLGNGSIRREKTLGMTGGFEPLHATLPLARRLMRILTPVIEIATLAVFHSRQQLLLRGTIAFQLVSDDDPRHVRQPLQQLAEELLGGFLVPTAGRVPGACG
jgi:hypothetical protein